MLNMFKHVETAGQYLHTELMNGSGNQPTAAGWAEVIMWSVCFGSVQSSVQQGAMSAHRFRFLHLSDRLLKVRLMDRTNEVLRWAGRKKHQEQEAVKTFTLYYKTFGTSNKRRLEWGLISDSGVIHFHMWYQTCFISDLWLCDRCQIRTCVVF